MEEKPAVAHEAVDHGAQPVHHHHSHAATSRHGHGHHLLTVEDLSVSFLMYDEEAAATRAQGDSRADRGRLGRYLDAPQREVEVIRSLSLSVHEGEIVAVVGASGSGKTLLADAVLGLFESNALVRGRIWFDGRPMDAAALAAERGRGIALVPQSVASLDPLMRVGRQVEGMPRGRGAARRADAARRRARRAELFARYGLAEEVARLYPTSSPAAWPDACFCVARSWTPKAHHRRRAHARPRSVAGPGGACSFRAFADAGGGVMLITHDIELALTVADRVAVFRDGGVGDLGRRLRLARYPGPPSPSALARPARARICRAHRRLLC
ncbi:MAG: ATP-binding cassette domain-containing protein [Adlercreutzia sp.]